MKNSFETPDNTSEGGADSKLNKELDMMLDAARKGYWREVLQAELGSDDISSANNEDRQNIAEQLEEVVALLEVALDGLGEGESNEEYEDGLSKGLDRSLADQIKQKIEALKRAL